MIDYLSQVLKCITPCIVPAVGLVGLVITLGWIKTRMIYKGTMPSDGPIDGFDSNESKIEFYSTNAERFRDSIKAIVIWIGIVIVGSGLVWFFSKYTINLAGQ